MKSRLVVMVMMIAFAFWGIQNAIAADKDDKLPPALQKRMDGYNAALEQLNAKLISDLKKLKAEAEKNKDQALADAVKDKIDELQLGIFGGVADSAKEKQITLSGKSQRGTVIGNFKKGDKITFQYVKGQWTPHKQEVKRCSPDDAGQPTYVELQACQKQNTPVDTLIRIPTGSSGTPFAYEFESDQKNVQLTLRYSGGWSNSEGEVVYKIKIEK